MMTRAKNVSQQRTGYFLLTGDFYFYLPLLAYIPPVALERYDLLMGSMIVWGVFWACVAPTLDALLADSVAQGSRSQAYTYRYIAFHVILYAQRGLMLTSSYIHVYNAFRLFACRLNITNAAAAIGPSLSLILFYYLGDRWTLPECKVCLLAVVVGHANHTLTDSDAVRRL